MADKTTPALRPSGSSPATVFDRLAGRAARLVSRALRVADGSVRPLPTAGTGSPAAEWEVVVPEG